MVASSARSASWGARALAIFLTSEQRPPSRGVPARGASGGMRTTRAARGVSPAALSVAAALVALLARGRGAAAQESCEGPDALLLHLPVVCPKECTHDAGEAARVAGLEVCGDAGVDEYGETCKVRGEGGGGGETLQGKKKEPRVLGRRCAPNPPLRCTGRRVRVSRPWGGGDTRVVALIARHGACLVRFLLWKECALHAPLHALPPPCRRSQGASRPLARRGGGRDGARSSAPGVWGCAGGCLRRCGACYSVRALPAEHYQTAYLPVRRSNDLLAGRAAAASACRRGMLAGQAPIYAQ